MRPLRPLLRAAATSCTVMAAGDVLCQKLRRERALDLRQTARFATVGALLHGPFFYTGFRWLDSLGARHPAFAGRSALGSALLKTAIGQMTLFPTYTVLVFGALGALEGLSVRQIQEKLRAAVPTTLCAGTVFWPIVNVFNFLYIPPAWRVLYVNAAGSIWNTGLSWINSTRGAAAAAAQQRGRRAAGFADVVE